MNNENKKVCTACGGHCCKQMPGCAYPEDFGSNDLEIEQNLIERLSTKKWAVDYWVQEEGQGYFLRPATEKGEWPIDPSWGGRCNLLTDKGCPLSFENRPKGCRDLIPNLNDPGNCSYPEGGNGKESAKEAWKPYWNMIDKVLEKING